MLGEGTPLAVAGPAAVALPAELGTSAVSSTFLAMGIQSLVHSRTGITHLVAREKSSTIPTWGPIVSVIHG